MNNYLQIPNLQSPKTAPLNEIVSETSSTLVTDFYDEKSVFITGATGFVGKVFERIRKQDSNKLNKIIPIAGDLQEHQLGISDKDLELLNKEISIVYHVAANIKFNCTIRQMVNTNTRPTEVLLNLSRKMTKLQAFIYVSTAYGNHNRNFIGEKIYPTHCPLDSTYYMVDEIENNKLIDILKDSRVNWYSYSKALAEELIQNKFNDLPIAIVRPSAIISSFNEPVCGWTDGWHGGANSVILAMGQGVLRSWFCKPDSVADFIPVDLVANLIIASAWDIHTIHKTRNSENYEVKVYNCISGLRNPITLGRFMGTCLELVRKNQFKNTFFYPSLLKTNYYVLHWVVIIILQLIPALIIDVISFILRREMRMWAIQQKLQLLQQVLEYFSLSEFLFDDHNVWELSKKLDPIDKKLFNIDIETVDWDKYLQDYVAGLKKYIDRKK